MAKKQENQYPTPETEISAQSGYSMQTLREWRLGRKIGKYEYKPKLTKGKHWDKIGPVVVYTAAGKKWVIDKSKDRKEKK